MRKKASSKTSVKTLAFAAMLMAMSVIIGIFCKNFLNFGAGLFRITFENMPVIMAGILLGPVWGGMVGIGSDLVSYLLSGQIYPLNIIVSFGAMSVGIVSGVIAKYVYKKRGNVQIILCGAAAHIVGSMIIKSIGLYSYYGVPVLWRIPLYLIIAPLEILVLCGLFGRRSFARFTEYRVEK